MSTRWRTAVRWRVRERATGAAVRWRTRERAAGQAPGTTPPRPGPWRRGRVLAAVSALAALLLLAPGLVPNTPGRLGSLLESFLPWLGLVVVPLLTLAVLRRSALAAVAVVLPVVAWAYAFGGLLLPAADPGPRDLVVVQHNVSDVNADPAGTARALAARGADLIALEELVPEALPAYENELAARYPFHEVRGTVGVWSRHPLTGTRAVDIKPADIAGPWSRGLRTVARTPHGEVAVYVAHLPSFRLGAGGLGTANRDESARLLGRALDAETTGPVIVLGDLNATVDDRGIGPLKSRLNVSERGFAFSFPASFPLVRIDQVMAREATVGRVRTLPATGSDHLPVTARVTLD